MKQHGFHKSERLCSRKAVEALFARASGNLSFTAYPLRAILGTPQTAEPAPHGIQVLIVVPKRRLRHAVDRNRAKRQVREAYRLNKNLLSALSATHHLAFLWIADTPVPSRRVHSAVIKILKSVCAKTRQDNITPQSED